MNLYSSVNNVLKRLDDYPSLGDPVWVRSEIEQYVKDGYNAFCRKTKALFDFFYPENLPTPGNYVGKWEETYFRPGMIAQGLLGFSGGYWEQDYADAGAIGPINHTQPWEAAYFTTTYMEDPHTFVVSRVVVPEDNVAVDRATNDFLELDPEFTRLFEEKDRNYQTVSGNPTRFSMDRDGIGYMRIVSAGAGNATEVELVGALPEASSRWALDETGGTRVDSVAGLDLTDNATVGSASTSRGTVASFVRANSEYLSRAASGTELYPQGSYTIAMWIYPTGTGSSAHTLISKNSASGSNRPYLLSWFPTFNILQYVITGSDSANAGASSAATALPNQWNLAACAYDATTKTGRLWLNDETVVLTGALTASPSLTGTCPLFIGASNGSGAPAAFYDGYMSDVLIFDQVLTDDEIARLYADRFVNNGNGHYGLLRSAEDDDGFGDWDSTGEWGGLREVPEHFPMGGPYGIPRRCFSDVGNTRVEYFRLGKTLDGYQYELPERFVKYVEFFAQSKALERDGPGQDLALSGHFMQRFDEGVGRMVKRLGEHKRSRVGAIGNTSRNPSKLGLARLPWQYGKQIKHGYY